MPDRLTRRKPNPDPVSSRSPSSPVAFVFFTEDTDTDEPSFGNYDLGGAVAVNFNRYVGVEGEVSGALGVSQNLQFGGVTADRTTPHFLNYSGNVVVFAPNRTSVVPYVTGGIGATQSVRDRRSRRQRDRDVSHGQRRRRRQVVRRPLGSPR